MHYVARRLDDQGPDPEGAYTVFDSPVGCPVNQTAGKLNPSARQVTCDATSDIVHAHRLPSLVGTRSTRPRFINDAGSCGHQARVWSGVGEHDRVWNLGS